MTKVRRRKQLKQHVGSIAIGVIVVLMCVFVAFVGLKLNAQNMDKEARIQELEGQIAAEEEKAAEIEEYKKYVQTKKFKEEVAKEKLGLVYEDEIIFKATE